MSKEMKRHQVIIGKNIRSLRESFGLSMEELANLTGLSKAFIGLVERGNRGAKFENLLKIAGIFGITLNELVKDDNEQNLLPVLSEQDIYISKINIRLNQMTERELDFIMCVVNAIPVLRND